jgi:amino acid adenylation domain-containing protein
LNGCIHEIVEAQALDTPDSIAVLLDGQRLTYRELNERANQLAHFLRKQGVGPDVFVGIYLDRTLDLVVGLLGILKAGGAYVPIDPQYPRERAAFMLLDSNSPVIVTQLSLVQELGTPSAKVVVLDREWPSLAREPTSNPSSLSSPDNLAYVIYTSGSTGTPKGTLISHRNVVRLFSATQPWFGFGSLDVWTMFHSSAFDFSVWELWGALFYGGRAVVVPFGISRSPPDFYRLLQKEGVTVLNQTPSAFRQLIRAEESAATPGGLALRYVIFGGEALDLSSLKPWFDRHGDRKPQLINMFGITETTVHVTYRALSAADLGAGSMIGKPIPDLQVYLLDEQQRPVARGEPGEIYVGGAGVARGYLNRPELDAQKFVPDPFAAQPGQRLYRSGDLGRYHTDGDLEYLGRIDSQVKIRGFRIELGEISACLDAHPSVRESVVVAAEPNPGDKILIAYVVKRPTLDVTEAQLRQLLRERLPEYMVPAALVFIDHIPLTVNGKLDVKALPPPARATRAAVPASIAAGSALEKGIAAIWCEVLDLPAVGYEQNFFDVGGNSMHVAEVHTQLQRLLGKDFSITELFAHPTIQSLGRHFDTADHGDQDSQGSQLRAERQRRALAARRTVQLEKK